MDNKKLITPRKLQGFWELMPNEQKLFSTLVDTIENVFKENCFVPLDTPVLEYSEALLAKSGGDTDKEVYRFTKGDSDVCMRYDLTVPLARFVAMHEGELHFPFKRYQIGKVYRGEKPQKGRFREFYQCDADIIGQDRLSVVADAECVNLFTKCFEALKLSCEVHVSNRKILSGVISKFGDNANVNEVLTILDKISKIGDENALLCLKDLNISQENAEKLIKISKINGNFDEIFENLKNLLNLNDLSKEYLETTNFDEAQLFDAKTLVELGLQELFKIEKCLKSLGTQNYVYDLSIIRGHDYYTGTVFEAFLKNNSELMAVGGGGRFDNLCGYFSERKMPGVGLSVGITRLFDILMKQNYFDLSKFKDIDCAVITFDNTFFDGLGVLAKLRESGVKAECFYENKSFKSQMKEANRRNVKYVVIVGEDEVKSKLYTLKNMETSNQSQMTLDDIANTIKNDRM